MLWWMIHQFSGWELQAFSASAWAKITWRAAAAAGISFTLAVLLGPRLILWLQARFREPIKSDSAEVAALHRHKQATPTMGGLFIVAGILLACLLLGDLSSPYLLTALAAALAFALLGAVDDLAKLRTARKGLTARQKLLAQVVLATGAAVALYLVDQQHGDDWAYFLPLTGARFSLGVWFIPLSVLVIVGASNSVNLTDGLDGLAGGCLIVATTAMGVAAYASGHAQWAAYLGIPHIVGAGEMTVLAGAMVGGVLGFLWFNCHPAAVFMGDTGSLPLGALLGLLAIVARQELLLVVVGGVFVVEALSVIAQVASFKLTGRRVLRCAPLHHHFQLLGWSEGKIVVRFWIVAGLSAAAGLSTLKTHNQEPTEVELVGQLEHTQQAQPTQAVRHYLAKAGKPQHEVRP